MGDGVRQAGAAAKNGNAGRYRGRGDVSRGSDVYDGPGACSGWGPRFVEEASAVAISAGSVASEAADLMGEDLALIPLAEKISQERRDPLRLRRQSIRLAQ